MCVRYTSLEFTAILAKLINLLYSREIYLDIWKHASLAISFHRKATLSDRKISRPVALTFNIFTIMETTINNAALQHNEFLSHTLSLKLLFSLTSVTITKDLSESDPGSSMIILPFNGS